MTLLLLCLSKSEGIGLGASEKRPCDRRAGHAQRMMKIMSKKEGKKDGKKGGKTVQMKQEGDAATNIKARERGQMARTMSQKAHA